MTRFYFTTCDDGYEFDQYIEKVSLSPEKLIDSAPVYYQDCDEDGVLLDKDNLNIYHGGTYNLNRIKLTPESEIEYSSEDEADESNPEWEDSYYAAYETWDHGKLIKTSWERY